MNKVVLVGRLTRNPETRYSQGDNPTAISRYTLAVDRRFRREGQPDADFIRCVAFGRAGEFADRYFTQGMRVAVSGRIQTIQRGNDMVGVHTPYIEHNFFTGMIVYRQNKIGFSADGIVGVFRHAERIAFV